MGLGCIAAMAISVKRGLIHSDQLPVLLEVMRQYRMPVTVAGLTPADIVKTTKSDKKMDSGTIRFILLEEIGKAYVDKTVSEEEMTEGLALILT